LKRYTKSLLAIGLAAVLLALTPVSAQAADEPEPETTAAAVEATAGGRRGGGHGGGGDDLPGVGTLTWGPCDNPTLVSFGAECAVLSVPLDYSKPNGTKIELAVSRVTHTVPDEEYQGIMLVNPGGPGGSGLIYSVLGAFVPGGVGASYDWIGFDPRGVGDSVPSLSCIPDYFAGPRPDYVVTNSREAERAWLDRSAAYSAACDDAGGELLDHVKTTDTVKDMSAIRQALGEEQLNFYGFSYGTYLAQVYATTYPDQVRRMVLDSTVNPRRVWYQANLDQDYAFEIVFGLFFDWVARHNDVYGLGTSAADVEAAFYAAQDKLRANPVGILGPAELTDAFLVAGYLQDVWPDVADAFAALVNNGDAGPASVLYEGFNDTTDDNGFAMYLATECTDARWPSRYWQWRRDAIRVDRDAPFLTWANTWFNAPCLTWPARSGRPVHVRDRGAPPILLVGETLDAATPFSGSIEVRRRFRSSVLIATEGGTTHANSLFGGNACVDDRIADYLRDGSLPDRARGRGPDVVCDPLPEPEPAAASASLAAASGARAPTTLAELHFAMFSGT
jgi:pimeloyl-ACP methyl ester carboxylesterase